MKPKRKPVEKIWNPRPKIEARDLDMLVWAACRHHIGTHSYAVTYAEDIAHIIEANRGCFKHDRLNFLARDIRERISDILNWRDNIHVENAYNDRIREDALTLLVGYLIEHPECDPKATYFTIDCVSCEVCAEPYPSVPDRGPIEMRTPAPFDLFREFHDLSFWVKLAASIDRRKLCLAEYQGHKSETEVIRAYDLEYDYDEELHQNVNPHFVSRWVVADRWSAYIGEEYITEIKEIER